MIQVLWIVRATSHNNCLFIFFQAEDGIRDLVRSRGLGDVYKRQSFVNVCSGSLNGWNQRSNKTQNKGYAQNPPFFHDPCPTSKTCLLYTSDAADERSSVDLGGRRIIKKKNIEKITGRGYTKKQRK